MNPDVISSAAYALSKNAGSSTRPHVEPILIALVAAMQQRATRTTDDFISYTAC